VQRRRHGGARSQRSSSSSGAPCARLHASCSELNDAALAALLRLRAHLAGRERVVEVLRQQRVRVEQLERVAGAVLADAKELDNLLQKVGVAVPLALAQLRVDGPPGLQQRVVAPQLRLCG
jgi:hypothetical protein